MIADIPLNTICKIMKDIQPKYLIDTHLPIHLVQVDTPKTHISRIQMFQTLSIQIRYVRPGFQSK